MSKSLKNFPDPNLILDTMGADATRSVIGVIDIMPSTRH